MKKIQCSNTTISATKVRNINEGKICKNGKRRSGANTAPMTTLDTTNGNYVTRKPMAPRGMFTKRITVQKQFEYCHTSDCEKVKRIRKPAKFGKKLMA